jgi:hypothetical protein
MFSSARTDAKVAAAVADAGGFADDADGNLIHVSSSPAGARPVVAKPPAAAATAAATPAADAGAASARAPRGRRKGDVLT